MMRFLFLGMLFAGCTHGGSSGDADAPKRKATVPVAVVATALGAPALEAALPAVVPGAAPALPSSCQVFSKLPSEPPLPVAGKNVVLTRFLKPCVTTAGERGYEKTTPYLAMGFPCTGGGGRIEIKGHYNNPKMVAFLLGTDCPLAPASKDMVQKLLGGTFDLPATAKLAAYTPFVVQYWEVPAMADADVGYALEMRSAPAVDGLWRRFLKHETVRVHLYGRENTWVPNDSFYFVEADLIQSGRTTFQLQAVQVKSLTKEQMAGVKQRCEALRPARNCEEVF